MKRTLTAVLLVVVVAAAAGCGGSTAKPKAGSAVSPSAAGSVRDSAAAEIRAARDSNPGLFAIFPALPGRTHCGIPAGDVAAVKLRGTCQTFVTYPVTHGRYAEAFVRFRESWGAGAHSSSWTLIVQWPAEKVVATQLHGEPSPQMRYAASDKTPSDQPALDSEAGYAERVAGDAHVFAGLTVDDAADTVHLNLVHAPRALIAKLRAAFPDTYVIDDDAPRTWHDVTALQKSLNWKALAAKGIDINMSGPTQDGHLRIGVSSGVAKAQEYFDATYGPGIIRVVHSEPMSFGGPLLTHPIQGAVAVRSTQAQEANRPEVQQWRKRPAATFTNSNYAVLRFVLPGNGCKPHATAASIEHQTLTIAMAPSSACTLPARLYEVTVTFAKPVMSERLRSVVARYGTSGAGQRMRIFELVYG